MPMAVVYECGPWTGCKLGLKCPQAVTQRASLSPPCLPSPDALYTLEPAHACSIIHIQWHADKRQDKKGFRHWIPHPVYTMRSHLREMSVISGLKP